MSKRACSGCGKEYPGVQETAGKGMAWWNCSNYGPFKVFGFLCPSCFDDVYLTTDGSFIPRNEKRSADRISEINRRKNVMRSQKAPA